MATAPLRMQMELRTLASGRMTTERGRCVCTTARVCVCQCVCMHMCVHACILVYACMIHAYSDCATCIGEWKKREQGGACVCVELCVCMYVCMYVCYVYVHNTNTCIYHVVHAYAYTYIHTYKHTHRVNTNTPTGRGTVAAG
jgi:hypothetical protein